MQDNSIHQQINLRQNEKKIPTLNFTKLKELHIDLQDVGCIYDENGVFLLTNIQTLIP